MAVQLPTACWSIGFGATSLFVCERDRADGRCCSDTHFRNPFTFSCVQVVQLFERTEHELLLKRISALNLQPLPVVCEPAHLHWLGGGRPV
jgi:hypothetical protein